MSPAIAAGTQHRRVGAIRRARPGATRPAPGAHRERDERDHARGATTDLGRKLHLVVVRLGRTAPHEVGAVVQYCKAVIDAFRPTAG